MICETELAEPQISLPRMGPSACLFTAVDGDGLLRIHTRRR